MKKMSDMFDHIPRKVRLDDLARELMGHGMSVTEMIEELDLAGAKEGEAESIIETIKRGGSVIASTEDYQFLKEEKSRLEAYKNSVAQELSKVSEELKHAVSYGKKAIIDVLSGSKSSLENHLKEVIQLLNEINADMMSTSRTSNAGQLWSDKKDIERDLSQLVQRRNKMKKQINITRDSDSKRKLVLNIDKITGEINSLGRSLDSISEQILELQSADTTPHFIKDPLDLRRWVPTRERTEVKDKFPSMIGSHNVEVTFYHQDHFNSFFGKHVESSNYEDTCNTDLEGVIVKIQDILSNHGVYGRKSVEDTYINWYGTQPIDSNNLKSLVSSFDALKFNNVMGDSLVITLRTAGDLTDNNTADSLETEMKQTEDEMKVLQDATKKMKDIQQKNKNKKPLM